MEKFKGTPGRWVVEHTNPTEIIIDVICRDDTNYKNDMYLTLFNAKDKETQIANANLIAAAPELLEALQELLKFCKSHNMDNFYTGSAEGVIDKALGINQNQTL